MKRTSLPSLSAIILLPCVVGFCSLGCSLDVAGEISTLSGAYVGDVVNVVVTDCLYDVFGIEDDGSHDEHAEDAVHSHDAQPLHDHEH